jgi:protein-disulfide isomerase
VAELTACLKNHDAFWRAHDLLFEQSRSLALVTSASLARSIGVEPVGLDLCASQHGKHAVAADVEQATALGLRGTPTFFVGSIEGNSVRSIRRLTGFATVSAFADVIADVRNHLQ